MASGFYIKHVKGEAVRLSFEPLTKEKGMMLVNEQRALSVWLENGANPEEALPITAEAEAMIVAKMSRVLKELGYDLIRRKMPPIIRP